MNKREKMKKGITIQGRTTKEKIIKRLIKENI